MTAAEERRSLKHMAQRMAGLAPADHRADEACLDLLRVIPPDAHRVGGKLEARELTRDERVLYLEGHALQIRGRIVLRSELAAEQANEAELDRRHAMMAAARARRAADRLEDDLRTRWPSAKA